MKCRTCLFCMGLFLVLTGVHQSWAEAKKTKHESRDKDVKIVLDETLTDDILPAWLAYAGCRALWVNKRYFEMYPNNKQYQYTFDEECECRLNMAKLWESMKEKQNNLKNNYFDDVVMISKTNYFKEYIWTNYYVPAWGAPSNLDLEPYDKWAKKNLKKHKVETRSMIRLD